MLDSLHIKTRVSSDGMLQNILVAGPFPLRIAIHKRGVCFPCIELHSSLDIPHSMDLWVCLTEFFVTSSLLV